METAVPWVGDPDVLWVTSTGVTLYPSGPHPVKHRGRKRRPLRTRCTECVLATAVKSFAGSQPAVGLGVIGPWEGGSLAQLPGPCPRLGHMCGLVRVSLGTGEGKSPSLSSVPTPEGAPLGGACRSLSFPFLFSIVWFVFVFSGP